MHNFFIRQNATIPILKMAVIDDGRNSYRDLMDQLDNTSITFSMQDYDTGIYKIANKEASVTEVQHYSSNAKKRFYIYYKFDATDTNTEGVYLGQFKIDFLDHTQNHRRTGELIVPIENELYIHVLPTFTYSRPA